MSVGAQSRLEKEASVEEPPLVLPILIKFYGSGAAFSRAPDIWTPIEVYFETDLFDGAPLITLEYRRPGHRTEYGAQHISNPFEFEIWKCSVRSMILSRWRPELIEICMVLKGRIRTT